ncbi:transmembrane protein [Anaeramoeba flamelloides]|uniref:Transmembrane protein n=1 Tax=Anaeramoeba flamelloides TaxID=1746091 RepID=A0AAV7Z2X6_9EUKA|nr:transmembrane protein [Anaeramoeba flamelloides]
MDHNKRRSFLNFTNLGCNFRFESFNRSEINRFFLCYIASIILLIILSHNGPSIWKEEIITKDVSLHTQEAVIQAQVSEIESVNRPLIVYARIENIRKEAVIEQAEFDVQVYGLYPLKDYENPQKQKKKHFGTSTNLQVNEPVLLSSGSRTKTIACPVSANCTDIRLIREQNIRYSSYFVIIKIKRTFDVSFFKSIHIVFHHRNYDLTMFEIYFRFLLLISSCALLAYLTKECQHISLKSLKREQIWVVILVITLIFYNNPLAPLSLLLSSPLYDIIDATTSALLICELLLYVLCAMDNFTKTQSKIKFQKFYSRKIIFVSLCFFTITFPYIYDRLTLHNNMQFHTIYDFPGIKTVAILMGLLFIFYFLWFLKLLRQGIKNTNQSEMYQIKFFLGLCFVVFFVLMVIFFGRISAQFNQSTLAHLSTYIVFNSFIFFVSIAYLPPKQHNQIIAKKKNIQLDPFLDQEQINTTEITNQPNFLQTTENSDENIEVVLSLDENIESFKSSSKSNLKND